jgi:hypothetical protein
MDGFGYLKTKTIFGELITINAADDYAHPRVEKN